MIAIVAILAAAAFLGLGASNGVSQKQVEQEVTELLAGIPQEGTTLGSARAPITLWVFADLECPTVKHFVVAYLPSIITTWVRTGAVKLEYRSLETDTADEPTFFRQETAALAAGRQDKMWNFLLTFAREQKDGQTNFATEGFLADIASQVPGLKREQWGRDREDAVLSRQVALGVYSAHTNGFRYTPSFSIGGPSGKADRPDLRKEVEASLKEDVESLRKKTSSDIPTLGIVGS